MNNYGPKPFYFINTASKDALDYKSCYESMLHLKNLNFTGCVLFNKPPTGFTEDLYLTNYWFETLENFILAGIELDLEIWINDGFNFPPGDAAGRIKKANPALEQKRLQLDDNNNVEIVTVPWGFPAFELPASSQLFIKFAYESMVPILGKYFGKGIYGIFSDCDNRRMMPTSIKILNNKPYFPWSDNFKKEFIKMHNYDITPLLKDVILGTNNQACHDYWATSGSLYSQWFNNNYIWCKEHNLKYTFHTSDTGPLSFEDCPRTSLYSEGNPLKLLSLCDYPGTDHELAMLDGGTHFDKRFQVPNKIWGTPQRANNPNFNDTTLDIRAKYAQSAAFIKNSSRAMCEMFAATNFGTDYQELKRIAAWQIMQGINFIVPHAAHHRFFGVIKYFAPPEFTFTSLANGVKEFNKHLTSFCQIASQGKYLAPIAIVDVTDSMWLNDEDSGKKLFELFNQLNKSACGYIIATEDYIEKNKDNFALIINPVNYNGNLDLSNVPGNEINFTGGDLLFMRRKLDDNQIILLACNVWSNKELSGTINFNNKEYNLTLAPGEYACLGGQYESYRQIRNYNTILELPTSAIVSIHDYQRIPIECTKEEENSSFTFNWNNQENLNSLALEVPFEMDGKILCDEVELKEYTTSQHWHEKVKVYNLPSKALKTGKHSIIFNEGINLNTIPFLVGNFGVFTTIPEATNENTKLIRYTYNLKLNKIIGTEVFLTLPPKELDSDVFLGQQGLLFYDKEVTFDWEFNLTQAAKFIKLDGAMGTCNVEIDVCIQKQLIYEPYLLEANLPKGTHKLKITLSGSTGALLEGGNASVKLGKVKILA